MSVTVEEEALMQRARDFYDARLRDVLEPQHNGEFVAIDPDAQIYAVGTEPLDLFDELDARGSKSIKALLRVGFDWTYQKLTRA